MIYAVLEDFLSTFLNGISITEDVNRLTKRNMLVKEFLEKTGMDFESIDIEKNCERFIEEMKNGLSGSGSSLRMIPTYISAGSRIPVNEKVIVLDAGGTNFRVSVVRFDDQRKAVIESFKKYPMPGTDGPVTKDEFFAKIVEYMAPVLNKSDKIGFCFSYATEPTADKDCKILELGKQISVEGLVGENLGGALKAALRRNGYDGDKTIIILNDSIATLLGGKALAEERRFDSYIGFILGTGTNSCYSERVENIGKLKKAGTFAGDSMIINIESGGYSGFPRGVIDEMVDRTTIDPGRDAFEKMVSGRYQGGLLLCALRCAAEDTLFSDGFTKKITGIEELSSAEIDEFLYFPYGGGRLAACCGIEDDRIMLFHLIDNLIERAARLVLINLAAILRLTGTGKNPCCPACITAEGSTFYRSKLFQTKLQYYIRTCLNDGMDLNCELVKAENATLIGTAIAALVN